MNDDRKNICCSHPKFKSKFIRITLQWANTNHNHLGNIALHRMLKLKIERTSRNCTLTLSRLKLNINQTTGWQCTQTHKQKNQQQKTPKNKSQTLQTIIISDVKPFLSRLAFGIHSRHSIHSFNIITKTARALIKYCWSILSCFPTFYSGKVGILLGAIRGRQHANCSKCVDFHFAQTTTEPTRTKMKNKTQKAEENTSESNLVTSGAFVIRTYIHQPRAAVQHTKLVHRENKNENRRSFVHQYEC